MQSKQSAGYWRHIDDGWNFVGDRRHLLTGWYFCDGWNFCDDRRHLLTGWNIIIGWILVLRWDFQRPIRYLEGLPPLLQDGRSLLERNHRRGN